MMISAFSVQSKTLVWFCHATISYPPCLFVLTYLSTIVALGFVFILLPQFNLITGKHLSMPFNLSFIQAVLSITLVTGLISGSYTGPGGRYTIG